MISSSLMREHIGINSHDRSWEQVARGLYGALIIEERTPPLIDHDVVVFVDDWRLYEDATQAGDFENRHDQAHAGRIGNFAKAIFQGLNSPIKLNQRIRLRLINAATDRVFPLSLSGVTGKVVAYDGMPLNKPTDIGNLVLAPAQRADLIADVTGQDIQVSLQTPDGAVFNLGSLPVHGSVALRDKPEIIIPSSNYYKMPDLNQAVRLSLTMQGGAMSRRMMMGMMGSGVWAFNDVSEMTDEPFHQFKIGQTGIIELINDTRFAHAIHLHGHHFQEIISERLLPLRDTILVGAGQSTRVACVFDNPGKWLLHCHMLAHQASGMKTWVRVT